LFERGAALDAVLVDGRELLHGGFEETEAPAAVGVHIAKGNEALLAPALDGFGGDVELAGDVFKGEHGVALGSGFFDFDGEGVGEEFDEGGEVRAEYFACRDVLSMGAELEAGDAEVDEVPGVGFEGVDGGEEFDGGAKLLAPLIGGRVAELVGQL